MRGGMGGPVGRALGGAVPDRGGRRSRACGRGLTAGGAGTLATVPCGVRARGEAPRAPRALSYWRPPRAACAAA